MYLNRVDNDKLCSDVKRVVTRVSRGAKGFYKLTPHFTEGSSLISSRFFPLTLRRATRHSFKFHLDPTFTLTPRGRETSHPRVTVRSFLRLSYGD